MLMTNNIHKKKAMSSRGEVGISNTDNNCCGGSNWDKNVRKWIIYSKCIRPLIIIIIICDTLHLHLLLQDTQHSIVL